MRLTPPSSRSFHDRTDVIDERLDGLAVEVAQVHELISGLGAVSSKLDSIAEQLSVHDEHSRLRWGELYRMPGEDPDHAKRRFFAALPEATGSMRLLQLANARLMHELDSICKKNGIGYWFCFGTLVAAKSRQGFIPWDDDIDICMMRDDVKRLMLVLEGDAQFGISVAYDAYVFCKQVRFCSTDADIPCFVDICVWDWATDAGQERDDEMRALRIDLMKELSESLESFPCWSSRGLLFKSRDIHSAQSVVVGCADQDDEAAFSEMSAIESCFERYRQIALEKGILCEKDIAKGVAYGLENIYDAPWRRTIFPREQFFPLRSLRFEGYEFTGPNQAESVCDECYPGWPYLPKDILGHSHFASDALQNRKVVEALKRFVAELQSESPEKADYSTN